MLCGGGALVETGVEPNAEADVVPAEFPWLWVMLPYLETLAAATKVQSFA